MNDGIKCQNCGQIFATQQGLDKHQSQTKFDKIGCHRAQTLKRKSEVLEKANQRKELISNIKVKDIPSDVDLSTAPHTKGSPIDAKEKRCIINLFQSFRNDGMSFTDSKDETAKRLKFSEASVKHIVREKYATDTVEDSCAVRQTKKA